MKKKNKKDKKYAIFPSLFILWSEIFTVLCITGLYIDTVLSPNGLEQMLQHMSLWVFVNIMCFGTPILFFFCSARRFYVRVTIDENDISRSLLEKFYKLTIPWDEMYEAIYLDSGVIPFLIFSKTRSICRLSYDKIGWIKDVIQISLTKKNYNEVKKYIKQPIIGLTDEIRKKWGLDK